MEETSNKEELLSNYIFKNNNSAPAVETEEPATNWIRNEESLKGTYTSENLNNLNMQQRLQTKLRLEALRRFLDETVSKVDLSTLTIPMDDKGEQ